MLASILFSDLIFHHVYRQYYLKLFPVAIKLKYLQASLPLHSSSQGITELSPRLDTFSGNISVNGVSRSKRVSWDARCQTSLLIDSSDLWRPRSHLGESAASVQSRVIFRENLFLTLHRYSHHVVTMFNSLMGCQTSPRRRGISHPCQQCANAPVCLHP